MNMSVDFPLILTSLVLITGLISLVDLIFFARKRKMSGEKKSKVVEYARSFFPVLLLVWVIRSFIVQPYRVPTGSLEPTILPGDFILVSQYDYGLRLPVIHTKFLNIGEPKVGDIALFRWPPDPAIVFVKRIIGTPGDHIVYKNKVLYINGKKMPQKFLSKAFDVEPGRPVVAVNKLQENLEGIKHGIYIRSKGGETRDFNLVVPKGEYFVMGDNRDNSEDSRFWGFVPQKNLIGKAFMIWMSWNSNLQRIRWHRIGKRLY